MSRKPKYPDATQCWQTFEGRLEDLGVSAGDDVLFNGKIYRAVKLRLGIVLQEKEGESYATSSP